MKFPYHVFHNDVLYAPFEDVPVENDNEKPLVEESNEPILFTEPETVSETPDEAPAYNRTIVNRMKVEELKDLARNLGYNDVDNLTGMELKREIIRKLHL